MTATLTAEDMQKRKNDVKARTTLLLSLPDEHQLRFSKYKTAQELWAAILKTFDGNDATNKTKKNLLKQQYGNFKAKGSETLEQTFNRLQSYMANDEENHALVADKEAPSEFALMANTSAERLAQVESRLVEHKDREIKYCKKIRGLEYKTESSDDYIETLKKELELIKKEKEGLDGKLAGFQTASKDLDSLLKSQRLDKNKEGLGYSVVPPPLAQIYSSPKKDLSCTGLPEFADDTITDYSRPSPTIESNTDDTNRNSFVSETRESPSIITYKPAIEFVKAAERPTTGKVETAKKPAIKYVELYRKTTKRPSPTVQSTSAESQNKNFTTAENGKSTDSILSKPTVKFVKAAERPTTDKVETSKKPAVIYAEMYRRTSKRRRVQRETTRSQNHAYKSPPLRSSGHKPHGGSIRSSPKPAIHRVDRFPTDDLKFSTAARRAPRSKMNYTRPNKPAHSYGRRPFQETTQDLMIILIQRVQRLERELKSRTPIHKVDRGRSRPVMAWVPKKD
nr:hypothetical protein [Tanacetum cinerariifolium]